jgi:AsmA-like C-terminal region/Protein of unknown function
MKRLFIVLSLFLFLFILGVGLFLKQGIHIERLAVNPATLHNISLQWHKKLELKIENVVLDIQQNAGEKQPLDLSGIGKIVPLVRWADRLFAKIDIQKITMEEMQAEFLYVSSVGHFNLTSAYVKIDTTLKLDAGGVVVLIEELSSERFQTQATGEARFDFAKKSGTGYLNANLAASLPVTLTFQVDQEQFSFQGKENENITTITPFVNLFGLSQNIQRWITEHLTGSRYILKTFRGNFPWDTPLHLLESFYAEVRVEDCQYTFAPGLEAIKTDYTDVSFRKGVLDIVPHDATFYGQDGEKSWLNINFNDFDNIVLTAYILTNAVGNVDIMNLLEYYNIPLPFVQTEGKTKTDLTLAINLNTEEITATGNFQIDAGVIEYDKIPYSVKDAEVSLENSQISIEKLDLAYGETLHAGLSGLFDATKQKGDIDIVLHHLDVPMGNSVLKLDASTVHPRLQYQIRPGVVRIEGGESFWKFSGMSIHLGAFTTPFSFTDYSGVLSSTKVSVKDNSEVIAALEFSGTFAGKKKQADLQAVLQKFHYKGVELKSENTPVRITYGDGLNIDHTIESQWILNQIPVVLSPTKGGYYNSIFSISSEKITYGDFLEGKISGHYDTTLQRGEFFVSEPYFGVETLDKLLDSDPFTLQLDGSEQFLKLLIPELNLSVSAGEDKQWSVHVSDLKAVHDRSPLLQQFKVDSGELTIRSADEGNSYRFSANIPWQYPLLVSDKKPIEQYRINGVIKDGSVQAEINDKVHLRYAEKLEISAKNILFNIPALSKFYEECIAPQGDKKEKKGTLATTLTATDSGLYLSPNSEVIAETLTLSSVNNKIDMELISGPGKIVITTEGEYFSLQGNDLNDTFMNALSPDAHLRNGKMTMAVQGQLDEFSAIIEVEKTVLEDFKTLNNVLAFVNTIPALITFSLPSYSSSGLHLSSAVFGAKVVNGVATIESMLVESPELSITGKGLIDFPEKTIDMDLNLITQSNKNMRKIPLVGYILAGKKKHPSITVKVSGDLTNPAVEHKTFKEVATIPFSILYRTLALPAHLVSPLLEDEEIQQDGIEMEQGENAK